MAAMTNHHVRPIPRRSRGTTRFLAGVVPALLLAPACTEVATDPVVAEPGSAEDAGAARLTAARAELDTLIAAFAALDDAVAAAGTPATLEPARARLSAAVNAGAIALDELAALDRSRAGAAAAATLLDTASRHAGQLAPLIRAFKRTIDPAALPPCDVTALRTAASRLAAAARSFDLALGAVVEAERPAVFNGPLGAFYVLDEGHIDAIDVAYEDGALGISIHDETVDPDVERDPAHTILVAKSAARTAVPDARFAFLGPIGAPVWILPEAQPDAEALGVLWPGLSAGEVEPGTFVDDAVELRFRGVAGPDGFSLFTSPPDELTPPVVLVDSEDGLPDSIALGAGAHAHANWAFEAPGLYLVSVDARGRLAGVPGSPWVTSARTRLAWVVLP
jgi:surface-anchored protein